MTPPRGTSPERGRTGRRAGAPDTRGEILRAARERFAAAGFQRTTMRAVAADAGVDPALISHYFDNKEGLFLAVMELPVDPATVMSVLDDVDDEELGVTLVRTLVGLWDSELGQSAVAALRSGLAGDDLGRYGELVTNVLLAPLRARLQGRVDRLELRLVLAGSQVVGLLVGRKILHIDPLASLAPDAVAEIVGPTVQRYLTGDLPPER